MNVNEKIEKIQKNFSIVDIVSPFSELFPKGKKGNQLIGICPICKSQTGFIISPQKNICKCFVCGIGGGPINFIMKLETLDFKEALNFIINKFSKTLLDEYSTTNYLIGNVYVLKLEDDCFYIGFSRNLDRRIKEHFSGNGSVWTKKHKPISLIKVFKNQTLDYENQLTEKAIIKYGYHHVRGGDHIFFEKKYGGYSNAINYGYNIGS